MTAPRQLSDALPNVDRTLTRKGSMFASRPPRRRRSFVLGAILAAVAIPAIAAGTSGTTNAPAGAVPVVPEEQVVQAQDLTPQELAAPAAEVANVAPFASTPDGLVLSLPSDSVLLTGFHEASYTHAVQLTPVGRCRSNENPTEAVCPPDVPTGPEYVVLSSRGRITTGTTAVDLVMKDDEPVISPVSGEVVDVRSYALYGKHPDHRIELAPDGFPHLRVVLIHVRDVHVTPGYRVVAGETELAGGANRFSFASHIDRYFPTDRWPHVHVEVKPTVEPSAG